LELKGTNFDNSKRNYNIEKIQYKNYKSLKTSEKSLKKHQQE
jgi:hypothetical protein